MLSEAGSWPRGYERIVLAETASTMEEAARAVPVAGPTWILALRQTGGRGRRGRAWVMPEGNFAATLLMQTPEPPARRALRSFVAAIALREAMVSVTGREDAFALKWPNDVLMNGGKVAGILLEGLTQDHLAIGIGVNLVAAPRPDEVEEGAVPPVALGAPTDPQAFLDTLAAPFARFEDQFRTYGFAPIRTAWLSHAARLGEVITARTARESWRGTFVDMDETGALVLDTAKGRIAIAAADVHF
ncbi:MAG: biotin--[acetyl-CoA-carboxylase] ligase [Pseudomonadota bacterium]